MNILVGIESIEIGTEVNSVNARKVYEVLKVKSKFSIWINRRINKNSFIENFDYIKREVKTDGRPSTEYYVTLDMAKHLSMLENNEAGMEARKYFIQVAKEHSENLQLTYQGKDFEVVVHGYKSQLSQNATKISLLESNLQTLIEENATLALPAPTVDVEPYKKHIEQLNDEKNKLDELKDHFSFMARNMATKVDNLKKLPKLLKLEQSKYLDFPEVYKILGALSLNMQSEINQKLTQKA